MLLKLIAPLLLLTMMSCAAVDPIDTNAKSSNKHDYTITNTTLILKDRIYEIQQNTSTIEFRVDSPVGEVWGSFNDFKGSFTMLNNGEDNQSAIVDINTESLHADSFLIKAMLKSEIFFNVEKFPSMHFVGGGFEWFNDKNAVLKGYLTMNNMTRPIAFYVELIKLNITDPHSNRITVKAETTIRRSEFGIDSMLPAISDNVNLFMSIDALRKNTTVSMM
jgi:polyisoprenoid-binding protein YceI